MVSLLCDLQPANAAPRFEASSLDAPLPGAMPNYTVDTLARLRDTLDPADTLFAIIGADAFLGMPRWRSPEALFSLAEWVVVSRPNVSFEAIDELHLTPVQQQRIHWVSDVHEPANATDIRALLHEGSDCAGLLPGALLQYIQSHHLYGC